MQVLIACEESGAMRRAFMARGIRAWSNDLFYDAADGHPNHIKGCCKDAIRSRDWDLIIAHPPCDYLALSGNRWYGRGGRDHHKRQESIDWTVDLWELMRARCPRVAMENPTSVIFQYLEGADVQFIQPHQFGHPEMKKTGLALAGLPRLVPTAPLEVPGVGTAEHRAWQKVWAMPPSPDRKKLRSRTYSGVADACAAQWGQ